MTAKMQSVIDKLNKLYDERNEIKNKTSKIIMVEDFTYEGFGMFYNTNTFHLEKIADKTPTLDREIEKLEKKLNDLRRNA